MLCGTHALRNRALRNLQFRGTIMPLAAAMKEASFMLLQATKYRYEAASIRLATAVFGGIKISCIAPCNIYSQWPVGLPPGF